MALSEEDPSEEDEQAQRVEQAEQAGAGARVLQDLVGEDDDVKHACKEDRREVMLARDRVQRHAADARLVGRLRQGGFSGAAYDYFVEDLVRYGNSVMTGWVKTAAVFSLARERGFKINPTEGELTQLMRDEEVREELVTMTVAQAFASFHQHALVGRRWDPQRGAAVTTYFMGACLLAFANVFKEYRRRRMRWLRQDWQESVHYDTHRSVDDPMRLLLEQLNVAERLEPYSERDRRIIAATIERYTQAEIVELFGEESVRAVEGVVYRWRQKQKKRLRDEEPDEAALTRPRFKRASASSETPTAPRGRRGGGA